MKRYVSLNELRMVPKMVDKNIPVPDYLEKAYVAAVTEHWQAVDPTDKVVRMLLTAREKIEDRPAAIKHIQKWDWYTASGGHLSAMVATSSGGFVPDDMTYRVRVCDGGVEVVCFGIESVDSALEGYYDGVDALPDWVKERLAVLMVMDSTPPTGELAGVGRRISESVFWVYAPTTTSVASTSA